MYATYNDGNPITIEKLDFNSILATSFDNFVCKFVQNIDK